MSSPFGRGRREQLADHSALGVPTRRTGMKPTAQPRERTGATLETFSSPTTVETVWAKIRAEQAKTPTPAPVTEPGTRRRTRIWCGVCGCQLYRRPGNGYDCRVCGWSGDAF